MVVSKAVRLVVESKIVPGAVGTILSETSFLKPGWVSAVT